MQDRDINCIMLFLVGGPSQIDTWDPKPEAPPEVRGPFRPLATNVPGMRISDRSHNLPSGPAPNRDAIARTPQTTPGVSAVTTSGARSGRSRKWIRPTGWPASTRSPRSTDVSQSPDSGASR